MTHSEIITRPDGTKYELEVVLKIGMKRRFLRQKLNFLTTANKKNLNASNSNATF